MVHIPQASTKRSPRDAVALADPPGLPIQGGWGYDIESACVIDRSDPMLKPGKPFNLIRIEKAFVERRIYQELIIGRDPGDQFSGIEWKLLDQRLLHSSDKQHDVLRYEISAFRDQDWAVLREEYTGDHGFGTSGFDADAHERRRNAMRVTLTREFWFDVTNALDE